ncbi:MAG: ASCH domain-containing protein [bacterium]
MNIISINVQEPYHSFILNGKKIVEGRLNKGKFASINIGDIIEMEPEKIQFNVVKKNIYSDFKSMLKKEGIKNVIPNKQTLEEAADVYYKFYTKEQENEFGVVAIKIKRISTN